MAFGERHAVAVSVQGAKWQVSHPAFLFVLVTAIGTDVPIYLDLATVSGFALRFFLVDFAIEIGWHPVRKRPASFGHGSGIVVV